MPCTALVFETGLRGDTRAGHDATATGRCPATTRRCATRSSPSTRSRCAGHQPVGQHRQDHACRHRGAAWRELRDRPGWPPHRAAAELHLQCLLVRFRLRIYGNNRLPSAPRWFARGEADCTAMPTGFAAGPDLRSRRPALRGFPEHATAWARTACSARAPASAPATGSCSPKAATCWTGRYVATVVVKDQADPGRPVAVPRRAALGIPRRALPVVSKSSWLHPVPQPRPVSFFRNETVLPPVPRPASAARTGRSSSRLPCRPNPLRRRSTRRNSNSCCGPSNPAPWNPPNSCGSPWRARPRACARRQPRASTIRQSWQALLPRLRGRDKAAYKLIKQRVDALLAEQRNRGAGTKRRRSTVRRHREARRETASTRCSRRRCRCTPRAGRPLPADDGCRDPRAWRAGARSRPASHRGA